MPTQRHHAALSRTIEINITPTVDRWIEDKWGWIFVALSYIGVSMAFPVYLVTRERYTSALAPAN